MNPVHHHVDRLDLNLLRIFAVVYRERHLTRAASSLCVTPSAVSHALRRLRAHFGDPLFIRDGKVMRPTPACARMAPEILEELAKLRSLLLRWGEFVPAHSRQIFRISMPEAVEPLILPDLMERLDVQAPEASAVSSRLNRRDMSSGLTNNIFDLAIDVSFTIDAPIRHQILFEDDFCVVVRPDHVLTGTLGLAEAYLAAQHIGVSGRSAGLL